MEKILKNVNVMDTYLDLAEGILRDRAYCIDIVPNLWNTMSTHICTSIIPNEYVLYNIYTSHPLSTEHPLNSRRGAGTIIWKFLDASRLSYKNGTLTQSQ
jgi:hypothetical protein